MHLVNYDAVLAINVQLHKTESTFTVKFPALVAFGISALWNWGVKKQKKGFVLWASEQSTHCKGGRRVIRKEKCISKW